ncbi:ABC transporter substrate-binding protein [Paraglaciecola arctica]|uniref:ABC transporter substrate-binding protein n=1 Tax=Paraglaciecola arctica TaxID=1128911 RepID=UPI001C07E634|nr:extracellular solute-binding protein [Paraglaciecola arctica]MBU3004512.1 extracellular solute-binding protein [Paraglaciecola arctica]
MATNNLPKKQSIKVSRRQALKSIGQAVVGATVITQAPYVFAKQRTQLKVLGTHVTLQAEIRKKAMEDLGIDLIFEPRGSAAVLQKALMNPSSFDLYEQWSNSIKPLWTSRSIQSIDKKRLQYWDEINPLCKTGQVAANASFGAGDAPYKMLHVQPDGKLGSEHTEQISFLPYVHNVDSFGYNTNVIEPGEAYKTESWGWLLDPRYTGKVGIVNAPTIGLFDLVLATQAQGLVKFEDIGNLTKIDLDRLFDVLIDFKRQNHFGGFWNSVPESVDYMRTNRVVIESMFSPAVSALNGQNIPVRFAAPKEGYRGWHGVMCLSAASKGKNKDAAYDYMNWWLSGWPGAFVAKQGYYISNPQRSAPYLSSAEWDYWYQGKRASQDLRGTDNKISVRQGDIRNGGSYIKRFSNVAVWNTAMPTYDYSVQKWYEFISS